MVERGCGRTTGLLGTRRGWAESRGHQTLSSKAAGEQSLKTPCELARGKCKHLSAQRVWAPSDSHLSHPPHPYPSLYLSAQPPTPYLLPSGQGEVEALGEREDHILVAVLGFSLMRTVSVPGEWLLPGMRLALVRYQPV